jgi:DNA helicase-2/ATP-dependent DNA helicase PcrA
MRLSSRRDMPNGGTRAAIRWLAGPDATSIEGDEVVDWSWLRDEGGWISIARGAGMRRESLESPAHAWFAWLTEVDALAVTGVVASDWRALADLLGFVVEPAVRLGIDLRVSADRALEELADSDFVEPGFGYAHTLERLRWLVRRVPATRTAPTRLPPTEFEPDMTQRSAVEAGRGVVQVIAPAGSGKTTVLVERVRELRRRGVPAESVACVTFNRAAVAMLRERLTAGGVGDVRALTFHGLGYRVLRDAGVLKQDTPIGDPTLGQWRRLCALAKRRAGEDGVWFDAGDAKAKISDLKLGQLLIADEHAATVTETSDGPHRTLAALFVAYEELQREAGRLDYDDLILRALRLLQDDAALRRSWQDRFEHVLVDEYQDIEPAQELLVRVLAAPHDKLFCVGDEDQTLYAFRRASVERIVCLDEHYPGLERIALGANYRCPASVVAASAALIAFNKVRFPKTIVAASQRDDEAVRLHPVTKTADAAAAVAQTLSGKRRGDAVALARTTNALRPIALTCADQGVAIDGPEKLFAVVGARRALRDHLSLLLRPRDASEELIRSVCRTPARSLRPAAASTVRARLVAGASFEQAFDAVPAPRRGGGTLLAPGELFELLAGCADAGELLAALRGPGGFDDWFEQDDSVHGALDESESEVLEQAEKEAAGLSPPAYLALLEEQARRLAATRDKRDGVELATIHGAKGREWDHVIVFACDEGTLPHTRALQVSYEDEQRGEGLEAERRLAYVAFTRAKARLEIYHSDERPSRFLDEAELLPARPRRRSGSTPELPHPPALSPKAQSRGLLARLASRGRER